MKILCVGDVVGECGRKKLSEELGTVISEKNISLTIVNGENLAHGRGISRKTYDELTALGVDGFTLGNHTWDNKDAAALLMHKKNIIRPANFQRNCPGRGSMLLKAKNGKTVGVINLSGRVYMNPCDCPFEAADRELAFLKKHTDTVLVDIHGEATSEKIALGWYLSNKVSAVFGTHTHVQTADEKILPGGCGYITDLGMTGPVYSVLGMERSAVIDRFVSGMPQRFSPADGAAVMCGCIFDINDDGKAVSVERLCIE